MEQSKTRDEEILRWIRFYEKYFGCHFSRSDPIQLAQWRNYYAQKAKTLVEVYKH